MQSVSAKFVIDLVNIFAQLVQVLPKVVFQIVTHKVHIEDVQVHIEDVRVHIVAFQVHIEDIRVYIKDVQVLSKAFGNWQLAIGSVFIV